MAARLLRTFLLVGLICLSRQELRKIYLVFDISCVLSLNQTLNCIGIVNETPIAVSEFELNSKSNHKW